MLNAIRKGYADTARGQVHYRRAGDRGPYLCLFHTNPLSSREFEPALPLLGRACQAIAFDTPGCGMSDAPPVPITIPEYAAWLLEAIDRLGIRTFAVGGIHTGAVISIEMNRLAEAGRITHMVLAGLPLYSAERRKEVMAGKLVPEIKRDGSHVIQGWQLFANSWGEAASLGQIMMGFNAYMSAFERQILATAAVMSYDAQPALEAVACPIYFLSAHDPMFVESDRNAAAQRGAKFKLVPGVAHPLPWGSPEDYAREVLGFIGAA